MRPYFLLLFSIVFGLLSCNKDDEFPSCVKANVIGPEQCSDFILVEIISPGGVGKDITYYDGKSYHNVIKLISNDGVQNINSGYYNVRDFDPERDSALSDPVICQAIYAPYNVPAMVANAFSIMECP
ncbi:hypothetical protein [Echinicola shivajiensis]|uniref:hypothetical protein n=1 Tax=Echinicola shivajiensis TaxID=1035916 RepID=UPI001BFC87A6|nr:hypothetical protein [Echinicola shivajiensis]